MQTEADARNLIPDLESHAVISLVGKLYNVHHDQTQFWLSWLTEHKLFVDCLRSF